MGFYTLILASRKAAAKRFKKRVTVEVLAAIRKTGRQKLDNAVAAAGRGRSVEAS